LKEKLLRKAFVNFTQKSKKISSLEVILNPYVNQNTDKDISWFFKTIINSRDIIDFKFSEATTTKDSVSFLLKNRTNVVVPMPIYMDKDGEIVFKKWLDPTVKIAS
jgi:hypothetical protein